LPDDEVPSLSVRDGLINPPFGATRTRVRWCFAQQNADGPGEAD